MKCLARLKNIRFKAARARVLSMEYVPRVLITWELEATGQNLSKLKFFIERGESPSELVRLNAEPIPHDDLFEFIDRTPSLFDVHKQYVYRVTAVEMSEEGDELQTFYSEDITLEEEPDLVGLYIVEEHVYAFEEVMGAPCLIYKRRFEGNPCIECWDTVLKRVTKSNCRTCYGTGKMDGYYPPLEGWFVLSPQVTDANIQQQGLTQGDVISGQFLDYPELRPGDILFEIRAHLFWKVARVSVVEKNRTVILQNIDLTLTNRSDIEYQLPKPEEKIRAMLKKFEERFTEPEF